MSDIVDYMGSNPDQMRDGRLSMKRDAVESMQGNLDRGEPSIVASFGLIGAIMLLGGAGFLDDRYLGTRPWCLLAGLIVGLLIGFYRLARVLRR
jgi:F0F1-type ATP synthase assembly protein I